MVESRCTTESHIPTYVTIAYISCTFLMLIITSVYSIKSLKQSSIKPSSPRPNSPKPNLQNNISGDIDRKNRKENVNVIIMENLQRVRMSNSMNMEISEWDTANCCGKFVLWLQDLWLRQSVYLPLVAHLSDTATDFAAVIEFYQIASTSNPKQCGGLDVWYLFGVSIACMIVYRLISSITIWRITKSLKRVILQFIDIELFEILYLSHRLGLKSASSPQRLISTMEAVFEAAPQAVIQMVYLMKTGNLNGVIFISTILSFMNLTLTIIDDDKQFLDAQFAVPWEDNRYDDDGNFTEDSGCYQFGKFLFLHLFRICDIPSQLLEFVFIWYFVNGYALSIVVGIDFIVALSCFAQSKNTDALLSIIAVPFSFKKGKKNHYDLLNAFWYYSFCRFIAGNTLIWIWIFIREEDEYIRDFEQSAFVAILWFICFLTSVLKIIFCGILFKVWDIEMYFDESKERSDINGLLDDRCYEDVIELIFYSNNDIIENSQKIYQARNNDRYSLLSITAGVKDNLLLFQSVFDIGLDHFFTQDQYYTGLMIAAREGNQQYIDIMMRDLELDYDYIKRKDVHGNTALYYAIMHAHEVNYKDDSLRIFLKYLQRIFKREDHADFKKFELLNDLSGSDETALHIACFLKMPLKIFQKLYEFYPESYQQIVLEKQNSEGETALDLCSKSNNEEVRRFIMTESVKTKPVPSQIKLSI